MEKDILSNRWKEVDKELQKYLNNASNSMKVKINGILTKYQINSGNLYLYLNIAFLMLFKDELKEILETNISEVLRFKINRLLQRTKIKNKEVLEILIEVYYTKETLKNMVLQKEIIDRTSKIINEKVQKDSCRVLNKEFNIIPLPITLLPNLMTLPLYYGYNYEEYWQQKISDDTIKIYRKILTNIDYISPKEMIKAKRKPIDLTNIEKDLNKNFKIGYKAFENQLITILNKISLYSMKKQGIKEVIFIATLDDRTTKMCRSMNEQTFKIDEINEYYRFEDNNSKQLTLYKTYGLKVGENLPALHYNCRSIIYPYK